MKKYLIGIAIGLVLAAIAMLVYQAAVINPQLRAAREAADTARKDADKARDERLKIEAEKNQIISAQDKKIQDLLANANKPSPAEVEKDKTIADLAKKVEDLEAQGDLKGALSAAKDEIKAWSEKFELADFRYNTNLSQLNKEWQIKYDALFAISEARLNEIDKLRTALTASEKRASIAERKIKFTGIWSKVSTAGLIILGACVVLK